MENGAPDNETSTSPPAAVGVLLDSVDSYFNHRVIMDLIDAAEEQGLHLVFYLGGFLEKHTTAGVHSFAYTLPDPETIQALIIFPHSVSPYSPQTTMQIVLDQYKNLPIYSFNVEVPSVYSVYTDETPAIEAMIKHLVEIHKYKRFAVLCGPDSSESISRLRQMTIQRTLETYGIALDDKLVFPGIFTAEDGKRTAEKILTTEGDSPDVLICMNDQMAIGAIREFMKTGSSFSAT
jgi:DNA-binding LacI/PurR family transcriptional regulator